MLTFAPCNFFYTHQLDEFIVVFFMIRILNCSFIQEWCTKLIASFCNAVGSSQDNEVCARMLSVMERDELHNFFTQDEFPLVNLSIKY